MIKQSFKNTFENRASEEAIERLNGKAHMRWNKRSKQIRCAVIMSAGGMQSDKMWKHIDEFVWSFIFITFSTALDCVWFFFFFSFASSFVCLFARHKFWWYGLLDRISCSIPLFLPRIYFPLCTKFEYKYFLNIFTNVMCVLIFFFTWKNDEI